MHIYMYMYIWSNLLLVLCLFFFWWRKVSVQMGKQHTPLEIRKSRITLTWPRFVGFVSLHFRTTPRKPATFQGVGGSDYARGNFSFIVLRQKGTVWCFSGGVHQRSQSLTTARKVCLSIYIYICTYIHVYIHILAGACQLNWHIICIYLHMIGVKSN